MKKLIPTFAIAIGSLTLASCDNVQDYTSQIAPANAIEPVQTHAVRDTPAAIQIKAEQTKQSSSKRPTVGTVKRMVNGDLMCYITLVDENRTEYQVGADFEFCAQETRFLNKKVRVFYETVSVNDCQSAEPCGKTRRESIITKMQVIGGTNSKNSQTISNGEWTIVIGNLNSWSGVNGTGNLSYYGCNAKGNCIKLNGGRVTCRDGICTTSWSNGAYSYTLQEPMDNPDRPKAPGSSTTLTVRKGSAVVLRASGFKVVSSK
ncbi:MAG TPA: hypothetical protein V6C91_00785 [Coleofasciculaceae cyanobacterium]